MSKNEQVLLAGLKGMQPDAVKSGAARLLVIAGAGSGKTEVMARRIAWWIAVDRVPKEKIVAFTFTERAAEEMKFRIRAWVDKITEKGEEVSLGGMYIGTIHGYCLAKIRELWPNDFHNYDILDEGSRSSLGLRAYKFILGLDELQAANDRGYFGTLSAFFDGYDQLQEHAYFDVQLAEGPIPYRIDEEQEWCKKAKLLTNVGTSAEAKAFAKAAARYYAYLRCRRFLDFSTAQAELVRQLENDKATSTAIKKSGIHLVVDEVQDINPVQRRIIDLLVGPQGRLTMVGDHRQSIYGFRGSKVEIVSELWSKFKKGTNAQVVDLQENFRSTPKIIRIANMWADMIGALGEMTTPPMLHGNKKRVDQHDSHIAHISFNTRDAEAEWIADAIRILVPRDKGHGAAHDSKDGKLRGLALADVAILVRSSTDVRTYMRAFQRVNIPCVVRAGPDLFSQPEVLLFVAALALTSGVQEFLGNPTRPKTLPARISTVLHCPPNPEQVLAAAAVAIRGAGLPMSRTAEGRLLALAKAIGERINKEVCLTSAQASLFKSAHVRDLLTNKKPLRRVFPQQIFHALAAEAEIDAWDAAGDQGAAAMFHVGALSQMVTGIETPGWTSRSNYSWQVIGLLQFGAESGRVEEQPLLVQPDAVSISTIHAVKGLEFAAVFLADVNAQRFPSSNARREPDLPMDAVGLNAIDARSLSDNENYDAERRLMYVALTRAERFLFVTHSGSRQSRFIPQIAQILRECGALTDVSGEEVLKELSYAPIEHLRDVRLATSFSDLRYYLECPHDFYLRKVLGFAPTIDQAFGYGRGVHNLMRAVHADPKKWAALAGDEAKLHSEIQGLIDHGLFYLRYTTGEPAENMRSKGGELVAAYVKRYAKELSSLEFLPEKEFETVIDYDDGGGGVLVSGAIDVIRHDNPPRVTLIDFKSGDPDSDKHQKLDEDEMKLQIALYALAAKKELEYEPEQGLVRYLDASDPNRAEMRVPLDKPALSSAKKLVASTAAAIRDRKFGEGPPGNGHANRCPNCDFLGLCGMNHAMKVKEKGAPAK